MNTVILLGRLTRNPELRYTEKGNAVAFFGVATNRGREPGRETYFAECITFGPRAEWIVETFEKGNGIFVRGRLVTWKGKKSNRPATRVLVENVRRIEFPSAADADSEVDELLEEALEELEISGGEEVDV
jgi:single-strand DNA-binding protein